MAEQHKKGGEKAKGFAANPENINRAGRPKDPIVQLYRDAIDNVITPEQWAKYLMDIVNDKEIDQKDKLPVLKMIAELRAPGLKLPPEVDASAIDVNITLND